MRIRATGRRHFACLAVLLLFCAATNVGAIGALFRASASRTFRATVPTKRVTLAIGGMDCKGCESGISGELLRTPGVIAVQVSYERQEAVVDYDPAKITPAGIISAIKGAGFTAKIKRG